MSLKNSGYTFYICFGKYAGFHFEWKKIIKRVVLGNVSIALMSCDIEILAEQAFTKINKKD